jgi:GT2 family glycosyltransferase
MDQGSLWVGVLDLDPGESLTAIAGSEPAGQQHARILVRTHRAPIGYVTVPVQPVQTIAARARAAAEASLADALAGHALLDRLTQDGHTQQDGRPGDWAARIACPQRYAELQRDGISVVICTRDRPDQLRECLRSLQRVRYRPVEILVVDNAPAGPETEAVVVQAAAADPRVRYLREPHPGISSARNLGVKQASFDLVAFTDDDTIVDPDWPAALAAGFAADPAAACVTGLVCTRSLDSRAERYFDDRYSWGKNLRPCRYDLADNRDPSALYPLSAGIFGTGANFAVRKAALGRLGEFDPRLGAGAPARGGEDLDMFVRVILAGERLCYVPAALVWHQHRSDAEALASQLYAYGHGLGAYLAKRMVRRELRLATVCRAIAPSIAVAGTMRQASRSSDLGGDGRRLALAEACGVAAGAVCFLRLALWKKRS